MKSIRIASLGSPLTIACAAVAAILLLLSFMDFRWTDQKTNVTIKDVDLGRVNCGDRCSFTAIIENKSNKQFRVVGAQACCGAKVTVYPAVVEARGKGLISGMVFAPFEEGEFTTRVEVFGDQDGLRPISFEVREVAVQKAQP